MHSDYDWLHEVEKVDIAAGQFQELSALLGLFLDLGFTLHDDVVSFDRVDFVHPWQHTSIVEVMVLHNGEEVFGFDDGIWNAMTLKYLTPNLPQDCVRVFSNKVIAVASALETHALYRGRPISEQVLFQELTDCCNDIRTHSSLEVGSEELAKLIRCTYPRNRNSL